MEEKNIQLGFKENWKQFTFLLIVNAFVGGMVGLERTILPKLAEEEFLIVATSVVLSFIIVFGVVKAITNYFTVIFLYFHFYTKFFNTINCSQNIF